jgi:hypothetical protein
LEEDKQMKHNISIAVAAFAVACAGCNARPGSDERAANTVTVTGCVQPAEQGLGSPKDPKDVDKFMLTNASIGAPAAAPSTPSDAPRSDAAPAPETAAPGTMYMLDGKTDELRAHLNQQVEITGRIDDNTLRNPSSSPPEPRQELNVESVRALATTCQK